MRSEAASTEVRLTGLVRSRWMIWLLMPFYALFFGEGFVRVMDPAPVIPRYVTGAPYGVRVGMPNMRFFQTTPETRVEIRTNSRGLRADREYSYDKPPHTCRVVLLGDSLLVGYEVDIEDSFAQRLERRLQAGGYRCEVVNLAVSGFGTAEMLVTLQEEGLKYHPDLVLFSSHVTDLDDNIRSALFRIDESGRLVRDQRTFLPGIRISDPLSRYALYRWIVENSQLYSAIRERSARIIKAAMVNIRHPQAASKAAKATGMANEAGRSSAAGMSWILNRKLLRDAQRVSESGRAHFCVLELPFSLSRTQIARMMPEYETEEARSLHVLSPLAELRAAATPDHKLFFEKGHGHLTPAGNRVVADYVFDELASSGWLDPWKK